MKQFLKELKLLCWWSVKLPKKCIILVNLEICQNQTYLKSWNIQRIKGLQPNGRHTFWYLIEQRLHSMRRTIDEIWILFVARFHKFGCNNQTLPIIFSIYPRNNNTHVVYRSTRGRCGGANNNSRPAARWWRRRPCRRWFESSYSNCCWTSVCSFSGRTTQCVIISDKHFHLR